MYLMQDPLYDHGMYGRSECIDGVILNYQKDHFPH